MQVSHCCPLKPSRRAERHQADGTLGTRWLAHKQTIVDLIVRATYLSFTFGRGSQTFGEQYTDILPVAGRRRETPSRRVSMLAIHCFPSAWRRQTEQCQKPTDHCLSATLLDHPALTLTIHPHIPISGCAIPLDYPRRDCRLGLGQIPPALPPFHRVSDGSEPV